MYQGCPRVALPVARAACATLPQQKKSAMWFRTSSSFAAGLVCLCSCGAVGTTTGPAKSLPNVFTNFVVSRTLPSAPGSTGVCFKTVSYSPDANVKVSLFCGNGGESTLRETSDEVLDDATVLSLDASLATIDPGAATAARRAPAADDVPDLEFLIFSSSAKAALLYVRTYVGEGTLPNGIEQLNRVAHRPPFSTWLGLK